MQFHHRIDDFTFRDEKLQLTKMNSYSLLLCVTRSMPPSRSRLIFIGTSRGAQNRKMERKAYTVLQ